MSEMDESFKEKRNFNKLIIIIAGVVLVLVFFVIYSRYKATSGLIVKEYKVVDSSLPVNFNGVKVVQISDIYYGNTVNIKFLEKIVKKVNELNPDIVVFTGDMTNKQLDVDTRNKIVQILKGISAKLGKYEIKGDIDIDDTLLTDSDFVDLNNKNQLVYYNGQTPIELTNSDVGSDFFSIYLLHFPDDVDSISNNYNLILAGHSLNGQINIPLIKNLLLHDGSKKYYKNYYSEKNLYISSGIGTTDFKFRLFNKPSINLYRLTIN